MGEHSTPHFNAGGYCVCGCEECTQRLSRGCVCEVCPCDPAEDGPLHMWVMPDA